MTGEFVTVLICTRDRAQSLRQTLFSLLVPQNLEQPAWEVLVVDNGSSDSTSAVCGEFQKLFPSHFRSAIQEIPGKSNALNKGIAMARGSILAMTDDDVLCAPDYISGIRSSFTQTDLDAAQGRVLLDFEGGVPPWMTPEFAAFMSLRDYGDQALPWNDNLSGCNMLVRTEVARKLGGFAAEISANQAGYMWEDSEFSMRLRQAGCRLIYAPAAMVRHQVPRSRVSKSALRKRYFGLGCSAAYIESPSVPLWRSTLYGLKQVVYAYVPVCFGASRRQPGDTLLKQCHALKQLGFAVQHWKLRFAKSTPPALKAGRQARA